MTYCRQPPNQHCTRKLTNELDQATCIADREALMLDQSSKLDDCDRRAHIQAIAAEAWDQWQDFCFVLSDLTELVSGTSEERAISDGSAMLGPILEHLSLSGKTGPYTPR